MNRILRIVFSQLLGVAIILLSVPADFLSASMVVVNHTNQRAVASHTNPGASEGSVVLAFLFWMDVGFVASFGLRLCIAAVALWVVLAVFGEGLAIKLVALAFLLPSVVLICLERVGPNLH